MAGSFARGRVSEWWARAFGAYFPIIESIGAPVVVVEDKDYQGDTRCLVRDGERFGILLFGWGSCSGCDALQGCSDYESLARLRNDFAGCATWFDSAAACETYIREKDWELDRCYHREESERFIAESLAALGSISAGRGAGTR